MFFDSYVFSRENLSTLKELEKLENMFWPKTEFFVLKVAIIAEEVERRFPELNVLLCNAGVLYPRRLETKDGMESTFQVGYLDLEYIASSVTKTFFDRSIVSQEIFLTVKNCRSQFFKSGFLLSLGFSL